MYGIIFSGVGTMDGLEGPGLGVSALIKFKILTEGMPALDADSTRIRSCGGLDRS